MPPSYVDFLEAVRILQSGGLVLMDTDTLPGFHCRADNFDGVARIAEIKGRDGAKPLLVLAGSAQQAERVGGPLNARQIMLTEACWPGPFSIILPAREGLAAQVTAGGGTVAVRVPGKESVRALALAVGFPLVSTSANLAGQAPAGSLAEAVRLGHLVDGILESEPGHSGEIAGPSALVDATVWPPVLLRRGPRPLPIVDPQS